MLPRLVKRLARQEKKISLRALAKEMKISCQHLWDMERGARGWTEEMEQRHSEALKKFRKPSARIAA